ncbi:hypothetical protein [Aminiphilus sp.]|uniref:hypothetical protein n=1 Tax=Aminiphilus sp. TaxID=1872488 RepID=UPI00260E8178|nr:hypothetical protein [Aminiphilus sp.]
MSELTPPAKFRSLDATQLEFPIHDRALNLDHVLYYRLPTPEESAKYKSSQFVITRKSGGRKVYAADDITPLNCEYGKLLCTGFKKGTLGVGVGETARLISSDPQDPDYHPQWKCLIGRALPSAFALLGGAAMNPAAPMSDSDTEEVSLDEIAAHHGYENLEAFLSSGSVPVVEGDPEAPLRSNSGS